MHVPIPMRFKLNHLTPTKERRRGMLNSQKRKLQMLKINPLQDANK